MRASTFWGHVALGGLMVCAATTASAKDAGFYVGADVGSANYPGDTTLQLGDLTLTSVASHDTDITKRITAGFRFSRYFAVEGSYVDLGEVKATLRDVAGTAATQASLRFKARGPLVNAIGSLALGHWEPFIKVGVFWQDVDLRIDGASAGVPFSFAGSADGTKVVWGTGVGYAFNEQWHLKLAIDYFDKVGDDNQTGEAHVLSTTVGLAYRF